MKFESFTPKDPEKESEQEKIPKPSLQDKLKRWAVYASVLGATFMSEKLAHDVSEFNDAHKTYTENLKAETKVDSLLSEVGDRFGEDGVIIVQFIKDGDGKAFVERYSGDKEETTFEGFESIGIQEETIEALFEPGEFFPANWIEGEVNSVEYIDQYVYADGEDKGSERYLGREKIGEHSDSEEGSSIRFYKNSGFENIGSDREKKILSLRYHMIHESAHANDWQTDKDFNLAERAELLLSVLERMESDNSFKSYQKKSNGGNYWEGFIDGTGSGKYGAAKEYWAEICTAYFLEPESMKDEYPKDFELVNKVIQSQDPGFNATKYAGPYFDPETWDLLPEWRKFLKSL